MNFEFDPDAAGMTSGIPALPDDTNSEDCSKLELEPPPDTAGYTKPTPFELALETSSCSASDALT